MSFRAICEKIQSTKSKKILRFSPKLRKRRSKDTLPMPEMADASSDGGPHIPNGLNDREKLELKQAFDMFDKNNDGKISCDELGCVLRTLGHDYTQLEVEDMIKNADTNENGFVEYDEFLVLMKRWSSQDKAACAEDTSAEDKTKETFKVFDMDGNGYIDQHELRYIMKRLGENLGEEDVREMFQLADLNGDGLIDYEEFSKLLGGLGGVPEAPPPSASAPSSSGKSSKSSKGSSKDGKRK